MDHNSYDASAHDPVEQPATTDALPAVDTPATYVGAGSMPAVRPQTRRLAAAAAAGALVLTGVGFGVHGLATRSSGVSGDAARVTNGATGFGGFNASGGFGGNGGNGGLGGNGASQQQGLGTASSAQQVGVVDIDTELGYQNARAAGTGMIVSSDGKVLTNNHVVAGETSMTVTVVATGRTYDATVVGVDPADDVAVVQMQGASGLDTVKTSSSDVSVGDSVTGVGNAGGVGGVPSAAPGQVTALDQTITATSEDGSNPETVSGLIETNAPIAAGDSGGPLFGSDDQVVGMDTAASSDGSAQAYAIPIGTALSIAGQIESGATGGNVQQGSSAFLGVQVQDTGYGAQVAGVVDGSAASAAGIAAGDVITSVDGQQVGSTADLSQVMASLTPGQQVSVTWVDGNGQTQQSDVTVGAGPAR